MNGTLGIVLIGMRIVEMGEDAVAHVAGNESTGFGGGGITTSQWLW